MSRVMIPTLLLALLGAALLVGGLVQARSTPTSEGAGAATALVTTGAVLLVAAGAVAVVLRRRDGA